jgi:hypothetical protein
MICIFLLSFISGCVTSDLTSESKIDIEKGKLVLEDMPDGFQKIGEEHITDPYIVEPGLIFEGLRVIEKYEVVFFKNVSVFLKQQLAVLESEENSESFIDTLHSTNSIPGIQQDYNFTTVDSTIVGDGSVLKKAKTQIDGINVTIFLSAFRTNQIVNIIVFSSHNDTKDFVIDYSTLVEKRLLTD